LPPQVITRDPASAPLAVTLGATDVIEPLAIFARFDGTLAASAFLPCVTYYTQTGKVFARAFPSASVAAGGSADVSWFPGLTSSPSAASSSSSPLVQIYVDTPDTSGNAFAGSTLSNGFTNVRRLVPFLAHGGTGFWTATIRVPPNYASSPIVKLSGLVNSNTGVVRLIVGT
jgi:hypothetical protein